MDERSDKHHTDGGPFVLNDGTFFASTNDERFYCAACGTWWDDKRDVVEHAPYWTFCADSVTCRQRIVDRVVKWRRRQVGT